MVAEHRQKVGVGEMKMLLVHHEWFLGTGIRMPPAQSMQEVEDRQWYSASCQRLSSPPGTSSIPPFPVRQWGIALQQVSQAKELRCLQLVPAYDSVH